MGIFDLYSKRNKAQTDIFTYDFISDKLLIRIKYIIEYFISEYNLPRYWNLVYKFITREHGVKYLVQNESNYDNDQAYYVIDYLLN